MIDITIILICKLIFIGFISNFYFYKISTYIFSLSHVTIIKFQYLSSICSDFRIHFLQNHFLFCEPVRQHSKLFQRQSLSADRQRQSAVRYAGLYLFFGKMQSGGIF